MAKANISFTKRSGRLGRQKAGQDHIAGILFFNTKPSEFATDSVKKVTALSQAEDLGITRATKPYEWYQVREFFRMDTNGELYIGIFTKPTGAITFVDEVRAMVNASKGTIKVLAAALGRIPFTTTLISALQSAVAAYDAEISNLSAIISANTMGLDEDTLADLRTINNKVTFEFGMDGSGIGAEIFASEATSGTSGAYSIGTVGCLLGTVAKEPIHISAANVEFNNVAAGELDVPLLGNGKRVDSLTPADENSLDEKGYVYVTQYKGYGGSYYISDKTCAIGDYDSIRANRVMDTAIRGIYNALLPKLNSNVLVNPKTGKLDAVSIAQLESLGSIPLQNLAKAGSISGFSFSIDLDQNILQTDTLQTAIDIVPTALLRQLSNNAAYALSV